MTEKILFPDFTFTTDNLVFSVNENPTKVRITLSCDSLRETIGLMTPSGPIPPGEGDHGNGT